MFSGHGAGGFIPHNIVMDEPDAGMRFTMDFGRDGSTILFTPTRMGLFFVAGMCGNFVLSRWITVSAVGLRDLHAAIGRILLAAGGMQLFFCLGALL